MTMTELVHCDLFPISSIYSQGIQYGSSLGSSGCNRGLIVNLHSLHESSRLRAVKVALMAAVPAAESILGGKAEGLTLTESILEYTGRPVRLKGRWLRLSRKFGPLG